MKIHIVATIALILLQSWAWTTTDAIITLDLDEYDGKLYSDFLNQIRTNVEDPHLTYGGMYKVPVMRSPIIGPRHLRIDLRTSEGTISLCVDRVNLYVVAYLARDNTNVDRAYYFPKKITTDQVHVVYPLAAQHKLEYTDDYQSLENACTPKKQKGIDRKDLGLGIQKLKILFHGVNRKARADSINEARFLLLAIQTVSEAARFKYIEGLVRKNYPHDSASNDKVIKMEVKWSKISEAIHSHAENGVFTKTYDFGFGKVKQVKDLEMGLLMNVGNNNVAFHHKLMNFETYPSLTHLFLYLFLFGSFIYYLAVRYRFW